jgi:hypothetical protein
LNCSETTRATQASTWDVPLPLHGASGREVAVDVDLASETSVGLLLSLRINYSNNGATRRSARRRAACLGVAVKKRSASAVHCSKEVLVLSTPRSQVDVLRCHCARLNPTSQRIAAAELCSVRGIAPEPGDCSAFERPEPVLTEPVSEATFERATLKADRTSVRGKVGRLSSCMPHILSPCP